MESRDNNRVDRLRIINKTLQSTFTSIEIPSKTTFYVPSTIKKSFAKEPVQEQPV